MSHAQDRPTLHMVSVGISKYQDRRFESGVAFAAKDAQDVAALFAGQRGKMFGRVESKLLTDRDATRAGLAKALDWLEANATADGYTLVFLAGHGGPNALGAYEYLVHDPNALVASTRVHGAWLRSRLGKIPGKRILILDTCHSGGFGFQGAPFAAFAACGAKQQSSEHPSIQNGYFTRCLLDGLRGAADHDGDGRVTLAEAERHLNDKLPGLTQNKQHLTHHRPSSFAANLPLAQVSPNATPPSQPSQPAPAPPLTFKTGPR